MTAPLAVVTASSGEILFLRGAWRGALVLAVVALQPGMALLAAVALLAACMVARVMGLLGEARQVPAYVYNPLLVGCAIGYRCTPTVSALLMAALGGLMTVVVMALLTRVLAAAGRLPIVSLPFAVVSVAIYAALPQAGTTAALTEPLPSLLTSDLGLPYWLVGFLRSLGAVLFAPYAIVGIVLAATILSASRILFVLAVGGYYLGAATSGVLHPEWASIWSNPHGFNFILIGMALGGVFLVPALQSWILAMLGVVAAPLVIDALAAVLGPWGVPPFTLPFCLVTIGTYAALRAAGYPLLAVGLGSTPEEVRESSVVNRLRYPGSLRTCSLPFAGKWTVWQGFNGRWTHKGIWRHAYDFVVTDEQGKTHRGDGEQLADFYCYRMPVLAPIAGRVLRVLQHLPDNPVGQLGGGNNWGNLVILHDPRGFYVELSHFAPQTVRVKEGDWVERGMVLGLCGNSGYSPQPHIHMQVQASDGIAAATLPFSFVCYQQGHEYHANDLPCEGAEVEQLCVDKGLHESTTALLDDVHEYEVYRQGQLVERLRLTVGIAADGCHYFETPRGRLYFGKHEGTLHLYSVSGHDPHLRRLLLALPRLPLVYKPQAAWSDYVPASAALARGWLFVARLASVFVPRWNAFTARQTFQGRHVISTEIAAPWLGWRQASRVELDGQGWFAAVRAGDYEYRRLRPAGEVPVPAAVVPLPARRRGRWRVAATHAAACLLAVVVCGGAWRNAKDRDTLLPALYNSAQAEKRLNYSAAIATLTEQLATHADDYMLHVRLGWLKYLAGNHVEAESHYRSAIASTPTSLEARQGCLLPLLAQANYPAAETMARELLELDPANYYGRLRLATALRLQMRGAEARDIIAPLEKAFPTDAGVMAEVARIDAGGGAANAPAPPDDAEWREALRQSLALEARGDNAGAARALASQKTRLRKDYLLNLRLGWLGYLQKQYAPALQYYKTAQEARPEAREAQLGQLLVLLALRRYEEVETVAGALLKDDPHHVNTNLRLAMALRLGKQPAEARQVLDRLSTLYPTDPNIKSEAALAALADHDATTAQRLFRECLALAPDHAEARKHVQGW